MRTTNLTIVIIAFLTALITLTSCGAQKINLGDYGDTPIEIVGLLDESFTITPNELAKLKMESATAKGATEKAGTVRGTGPSLTTFLAQYGKTPADFAFIRFTALDAYTQRFVGASHTDDVFIMAITNGSQPLSASEEPMRLIIPDAESNQWIYAVVRIEFTPLGD